MATKARGSMHMDPTIRALSGKRKHSRQSLCAGADQGIAMGQRVLAKSKRRVFTEVQNLQPSKGNAALTKKQKPLIDPSSKRRNSLACKVLEQMEKNRASKETRRASKLVSKKATAVVAPIKEVEVPESPVVKPTAKGEKPKVADSLDMKCLDSALDEVVNSKPEGVVDIDAEETDYLQCKEYAQDQVDYLQQLERRWKFTKNYLTDKDHVKPSMRAVLVDWLIQVQDHLQLENSTLYMAVNLLDKFMSTQPLSVAKLQLAGVTSVFIAAKYLERFPPEISTLIHLTDNTYSYKDVIRMELIILRVLKFDLSAPCPLHFLNRLLQACPHDQKIQNLCQYLLDLSLSDMASVEFPASMKAAAAVYISKKILEEEDSVWTPTLQYYSSYTESQLEACVDRMTRQLARVKKVRYQGAHNKYASMSKYGGISQIPLLKSSPFVIEKAEE